MSAATIDDETIAELTEAAHQRWHAPGSDLFVNDLVGGARLVVSLGTNSDFASRPLFDFFQGEKNPAWYLQGVGMFGRSMNALRNDAAEVGVDGVTNEWRFNFGIVKGKEAALLHRFYELYNKTCEPFTLVGSSLGGLEALEVARVACLLWMEECKQAQAEGRELPPGPPVKQTILLVTPGEMEANEIHDGTNLGSVFDFMNRRIIRLFYDWERMNTWKRQSDLPEVPFQRTSIIAVRDGIVDPRACILPDHPGCVNIFLDTTHSDVHNDPVAKALVTWLTLNGNQVPIPEQFQPFLLNETDILPLGPRLPIPELIFEDLERKTANRPVAGRIVRGTHTTYDVGASVRHEIEESVSGWSKFVRNAPRALLHPLPRGVADLDSKRSRHRVDEYARENGLAGTDNISSTPIRSEPHRHLSPVPTLS
jgi:hypothetical protein